VSKFEEAFLDRIKEARGLDDSHAKHLYKLAGAYGLVPAEQSFASAFREQFEKNAVPLRSAYEAAASRGQPQVWENFIDTVNLRQPVPTAYEAALRRTAGTPAAALTPAYNTGPVASGSQVATVSGGPATRYDRGGPATRYDRGGPTSRYDRGGAVARSSGAQGGSGGPRNINREVNVGDWVRNESAQGSRPSTSGQPGAGARRSLFSRFRDRFKGKGIPKVTERAMVPYAGGGARTIAEATGKRVGNRVMKKGVRKALMSAAKRNPKLAAILGIATLGAGALGVRAFGRRNDDEVGSIAWRSTASEDDLAKYREAKRRAEWYQRAQEASGEDPGTYGSRLWRGANRIDPTNVAFHMNRDNELRNRVRRGYESYLEDEGIKVPDAKSKGKDKKTEAAKPIIWDDATQALYERGLTEQGYLSLSPEDRARWQRVNTWKRKQERYHRENTGSRMENPGNRFRSSLRNLRRRAY